MLLKRLMALLMLLSISGYAFAQFTGDGFKNNVVSTQHDLRSQFTSATQVCEFCHTPHKFTATANPPLLWNVTVPTGPYTTYTSSSFNGATDIRDPAAGTGDASYMTLLCLSCHDGTVTEASFYELPTGTTGAATINAPDIGFGGLANDHPVDFTYSVALATADGGLQSPTEGATVRIPYVGTGNLPLYKDNAADVSGRMECATCHNPHDDTNGLFLRMGNTGSLLCLNCHGS